MRRCRKCGVDKPTDQFHIHKKCRDGLNPTCKDCRRILAHERYVLNRETILKKYKEYYQENIESVRKRHTDYREINKERLNRIAMEHYYANWDVERQRRDEWTRRNWDKRLAYHRKWKAERRARDYSYKVHSNVSRRLRDSLTNGGVKSGKAWERLLGYTTADLMSHLESRFTDGMSWDNYGEWHIDHICPIKHFKVKSDDNKTLLECWKLNNLQPLWAKDNITKKDKYLIRGTVKQ